MDKSSRRVCLSLHFKCCRYDDTTDCCYCTSQFLKNKFRDNRRIWNHQFKVSYRTFTSIANILSWMILYKGLRQNEMYRYLILSNCKSLWIKASAKWMNVNGTIWNSIWHHLKVVMVSVRHFFYQWQNNISIHLESCLWASDECNVHNSICEKYLALQLLKTAPCTLASH